MISFLSYVILIPSVIILYSLIGGITFAVTERWGWGKPYSDGPPPELMGIFWPLFLPITASIMFTVIIVTVSAKFGRFIISIKLPKRKTKSNLPEMRAIK